MVVGSSPVTVILTLDIAPVSSKEFLDIKANIECGFTLKYVRDMIRTYRQEIWSRLKLQVNINYTGVETAMEITNS